MTATRIYPIVYYIGAVLFFGAVAAGVVQSLRIDGRLPTVNSSFDTYIDELIQKQEFERAVREVRMATAQYGANRHMALNNLGRVLALQGKYLEAKSHFEEAIYINPEYPDAYNNLGLVFMNMGQPAQSEKLFLRALELSPEFAKAHNNLGRLFAKRRDLTRAISHFERAVALEPDLVEAQKNLNLARQIQQQRGQRSVP